MLWDLHAGAPQPIALDVDEVRFMVVASIEGVADDLKLLPESGCSDLSMIVQLDARRLVILQPEKPAKKL